MPQHFFSSLAERLKPFLFATRFSPTAIVAVFFIYEALILLRAAPIILSPRFVSEDGAVFFQYALDYPWFDALIAPHMGYYSLFANLSTVLAANVASLENAPALPMIFALIAQLLPCMVVLCAKGKLFDCNWKKLAVLGIVLFAPTTRGIWLCVHTSIFHFGITALLILIADVPTHKGVKWFYRGTLLLAGLNGVLAVLLLPFFIFRAYRLRSREAMIQVALLGVGALVQWIAILSQWQAAHTKRTVAKPWLWLLPLTFNNNYVLPFAGWGAALEMLRPLRYAVYPQGDKGILNVALLALLLTAWLVGRPRDWRGWVLPLVFIGWAVFCYHFAKINYRGMLVHLHPGQGARYYYLTTVALGLTILAVMATDWHVSNRLKNRVCAVLVGVMILQGAWQWVAYPQPLINNAPDWQEEVRKWRNNPRQKTIQLWGPAFQVRPKVQWP